MAYGNQLIAARDPETGRNIAQVFRMNSDGISIDTNDGTATDSQTLESELLNEERRGFLLDHAPSSVPVHGADGSSRYVVMPWWAPTRVHASMAKEMAEQYRRAAHRSRCIFFATLPHFHDPESVRQLEALMGTETFNVEILNKGVGGNNKRPAFTSDGLLRFHHNQNGVYNRPGDHPYVFVSFDPAGGGALSDPALVSAIYDDDYLQQDSDMNPRHTQPLLQNAGRARQRMIVSMNFSRQFGRLNVAVVDRYTDLVLQHVRLPHIVQIGGGGHFIGLAFHQPRVMGARLSDDANRVAKDVSIGVAAKGNRRRWHAERVIEPRQTEQQGRDVGMAHDCHGNAGAVGVGSRRWRP